MELSKLANRWLLQTVNDSRLLAPYGKYRVVYAILDLDTKQGISSIEIYNTAWFQYGYKGTHNISLLMAQSSN